MITIAVTGTRYATAENRPTIRRTLWDAWTSIDAPPDVEVTLRHGAAEGVDTISAHIAEHDFGWNVRPFPARWGECGDGCPPRPHLRRKGNRIWCPVAGGRRNGVMLATDPRPDRFVALPAIGSHGAGGTWDCIERAVDLGLTVHQIVPLRVAQSQAMLPLVGIGATA